ncbi:MAG: hypothetical protein HRT66_07300 [Flavobacteriaceae bacterium]|nr:hypothetical protein [Flavobacteriaceae bacterium]
MKYIKNIKNILLIAFLMFSVMSCDEGGDLDPGGTVVEAYAGDWFVTTYGANADGTINMDDVKVGPTLHFTYNTAADDNTMWIDDHKEAWWIKSKLTVDLATGELKSVVEEKEGVVYEEGQVENLIDGSKVIITEGKIVKDGGESKGGHVVDAISMKIVFDYGDVIFLVGHKRTGFLEDEY